MLVWSQICAGLALYRNQFCSNESTNYFCNRQFLELNGACGLRPQSHPFGDKFLRFDRCQSCSCGTFRLVWIGRGYQEVLFVVEWMGDILFLVSWLLPETIPVRSPFLYIVVRNVKEIHCVLNEFLILLCSFSQEVPARAVEDADVPVW